MPAPIRAFQRAARRPSRLALGRALVLALTASLVAATLAAAGTGPTRPIRPDQTDGFGNDRVVVFTYGRNYDCVTMPTDDNDNDGIPAATDPDEFQRPHCVVGRSSAVDPNLRPVEGTEKLWVLVPFFDADGDEQAAGGLAPTLKGLFGIVPDAFDPTPGVDVQCPEPGAPLTQHKGAFSTCTMHPTQLDLGPLVAAGLGLPAGTPVFLPTVNHSHLIDGANFGNIWWHIQVVLVLQQSEWPDANGTRGITSLAKLRAAQAAGKASPDVTSNFFLPFDSRQLEGHGH
jgi:hypothetical protein